MASINAVLQILRIARGHIILGGALAFTLGLLLAVTEGGAFDPFKVVLFYAIVFFGDLSTHYSNDYFDVNNDRLTVHKKVFSGKKVLVNNPNLLPTARYLSLVFLSISIALSITAVALHIAPIELLLIALGANFLGWFYSAPPLRLVSKGLGELAIALAVGFAIPAVGYLAVAGRLDWFFSFFVLPFVLYGFMLALSLEAPDIEADRQGDKKNIGVRAGERVVFGFVLAAALASFAGFVFCAWQVAGLAVDFWAVTAFSAVPLAAGILGFVSVLYKKKPYVFSAINVSSLFAFNVLMIVYLAIIVLKV